MKTMTVRLENAEGPSQDAGLKPGHSHMHELARLHLRSNAGGKEHKLVVMIRQVPLIKYFGDFHLHDLFPTVSTRICVFSVCPSMAKTPPEAGCGCGKSRHRPKC
jgi:hypothetical protein